jgi:hypothetical protein
MDQHRIVVASIDIAKMQASAPRFVFAIPEVWLRSVNS